MMKEQILEFLPAECPWKDTLHWFTQVTSTNTLAKNMASQGAPHGTVLIADSQTGGRGRMGRSFASAQGKGIYMSVILRPQCPAKNLMHLTCAVGVAVCDAVEQVCGVRPGIKWINDLVLGKKKLGGILTELSIHQDFVQYAVVGIGLNCNQRAEDFPEEIRAIAQSLQDCTGKNIDIPRLTGAIISALWKMDLQLFHRDFMTDYKKDCITLGQDISVVQGAQVRYGQALDLTADGGLVVQFSDGTLETVQSGDVSIRGMYGYI
jgi:BirA family biotin operon repressor/biotin-[acetyl-CoA-carboxylase] ligase